MNKIFIKLYVPIIEESYDVWIPVNRKVYDVIYLLIKAVNEMSRGNYRPLELPFLYDKLTTEKYNLELMIKDTEIRNGSELILI